MCIFVRQCFHLNDIRPIRFIVHCVISNNIICIRCIGLQPIVNKFDFVCTAYSYTVAVNVISRNCVIIHTFAPFQTYRRYRLQIGFKILWSTRSLSIHSRFHKLIPYRRSVENIACIHRFVDLKNIKL